MVEDGIQVGAVTAREHPPPIPESAAAPDAG